jgi:hypothetical protein
VARQVRFNFSTTHTTAIHIQECSHENHRPTTTNNSSHRRHLASWQSRHYCNLHGSRNHGTLEHHLLGKRFLETNGVGGFMTAITGRRMNMEKTEQKGMGAVLGVAAGLGGAFGIWACMAFITGLSSVDFQVTEMFRNFLVSTGNLGEYETMVDLYPHIKGVEYLMAGAFFVAFPVFFKYINKENTAVKTWTCLHCPVLK